MNDVKSSQSESESPDYRETFSLVCAPFENSGDSRFFYASTALMQRLDLLTHLTQFGESVVLVSGPAGSGKTTLLGSFATQANNRWQLCILDGDAPQQLGDRLVSALGADPGISLEDALSNWDSATDTSRLLVIAIDNAERLDQQICENLCRLAALPQGERIRIVLFGTDDAQPRVRKALQQQGVSQSMQLLEVPRLSEEETASYLMYRLAVAGYSGESPFTATEVRAICKAADGRPAATNELAHQTLMEHSLRTRSKRPYSMPAAGRNLGPLWLAATAGVLILVAYAGWQRFTGPEIAEHKAPQLAQTPLREEVPLTIPEAPPAAPAIEPSAVSQQAAALSERLADNESVAATAEMPSASAQDQLPEETLVETPSTLVAESATAAADQANAHPQDPAASPEPESSTASAASASEETAIIAQTQADASAAQPAPARSETSSDETYPHRESWLLQQPENRYSLQLLGSRSEQSVTRFIADHKLDVRKAAYYRGRYKNAEWYVLMYGIYPSRDAALQQAQTLPSAIRKEKPWPRDMKSVQAAIRDGMQPAAGQ